MRDRHRQGNITIKGVVCPTEWNDEGRVERISIVTWDEDEYEVLQEGAGLDLIEFTNRVVTVRGHILPEFRKRRVVRIKSFSVPVAREPEIPLLNPL